MDKAEDHKSIDDFPMLVSQRLKRSNRNNEESKETIVNITPNHSFKLRDFSIELFMNKKYLIIEAENVLTGGFYIRVLTDEEIYKITRNLFSDPFETAEIIQYASQERMIQI